MVDVKRAPSGGHYMDGLSDRMTIYSKGSESAIIKEDEPFQKKNDGKTRLGFLKKKNLTN